MGADPRELLAHAGWLRRLAVSLVGAGGGADDLVQDTWLAALRRPPREDGPLRPWLGQVLRNLARMRARHGGVVARKQPEVARKEASRAAPTPEALLGRLETERLLARLVAELDEPFRSTVLLRYFEGLSAADIARAQGVPAATVRWRLMTGLERLRGALDAHSHGERRTWRLALLPLAASAPARRLMVAKGILLMTRAQKIGAGAAALLGLLALLLGLYLRGTRAPAPAPTAAPARAPAAPTGASAPAPAPAPAPARAQGPSPPSPGDLVAASGAKAVGEPSLANGAFSGVVLNWSTGRPLAGAQVTFSFGSPGPYRDVFPPAQTASGPDVATAQLAVGSAESGTTSVTSDAEGRFELLPAQPGRYVLAVASAPGFLPFAPEWDHSPIRLQARPGLRIRDITIYLRPALDYLGVVLAPDGKPLAGATVTLLGASAGEMASSPIVDRYTSDAAGEFVFHSPDDAILEARHPRYGPGRARLDGPAQVSHRLEIKLGKKSPDDALLGSGSIRGKVVDGAGKPVSGALVHAEHSERGPEALHPAAEAHTGGDGRFALAGLDPGQHELTARCSGCPVATARAATGSEVTLTMAAGGSLAGRVVEQGGAAVPAFSVLVSKPRGITEELITEETVIDGEGRFQIDGLEPGMEVRVRATAAGLAPSPPAKARVGDPGEDPVEVSLTLPRGGTLRGRVTERGTGVPLPYARVSVEGGVGEGPSAVPITATTVTDDNGAFTLGGVAPGIHSVLAAAGGHHMRLMAGLTVEDGGTLGPLDFELTALKEGEQPTIETFGIGAQLSGAEDALLIGRVIPGGGAEQAGLQAGDGIVRIDGILVTEIGFDQAIQRIRGPEGTRLRLAVRRGGNIIEMTVERRRIVF